MAASSETNPLPQGREQGRAAVARTRLVLAAEALMAQRGIGSVSLREVAVVAGQGNTNAVRYHFGSKEGLLDAIFTHRVAEMDAPRRRMLQVVRARKLVKDALTLLEVLFLPHLDLVDSEGRHPYAQFLLQYVAQRWPDSPYGKRGTIEEVSPALNELMGLLIRRIDHVPPDVASSRIQLCNSMFLTLIARWDHRVGMSEERSLGELVRDTLDSAVLAMCAPFQREPLGPTSVAGWTSHLGN